MIVNVNSEIDRQGKSPMVKLPRLEQHDNTKEKDWQKLDLGWAKVNVKGSFLEDTSSGAWRTVVRDYDGRIILSAWDYMPRCNGADFAEDTACLEVLPKVMSCTELPLVIETDISSVAKALGPSCVDRSKIGVIAKEFQVIRQGNR